MLRNMLGPVFNFNLDQFLTLEICYVFFWGGGAETPIFIVFSVQQKCKIERNTEKKKYTICEHTCANSQRSEGSYF